MPTIARFTIHIEAALFKTLLEEKGIPCALVDNSACISSLGNMIPSTVDVPPEYVAQATAVYLEYSKDNKARADRTERTHPNRGFPFFALFAITTVLFWLIYAAVIFLPAKSHPARPVGNMPAIVARIFLQGIVWGVVMTALAAFARVIRAAFKKKHK